MGMFVALGQYCRELKTSLWDQGDLRKPGAVQYFCWNRRSYLVKWQRTDSSINYSPLRAEDLIIPMKLFLNSWLKGGDRS